MVGITTLNFGTWRPSLPFGTQTVHADFLGAMLLIYLETRLREITPGRALFFNPVLAVSGIGVVIRYNIIL